MWAPPGPLPSEFEVLLALIGVVEAHHTVHFAQG
jgi:hypothetical protein